MAQPTTGRESMYRDKRGGKRVQGVLTAQGAKAFERHRARLMKTYKREKVSDADVIEYLARKE